MERKFTEQEEIRRKKLGELINSGADPYQVLRFDRNYNSATFKQAFEKYTKDELHSNTSKVTIAGRIMAIRQTFVVIKDFFGRVQLYIDRKSVESKYLEIFNNSLDIGDIVGIEGTPMKTNTGEVTVRVKTITLLSKALKPLPEKFHGLVDEEGRGRHRYVDLIMNDESMNTFILRSKIVTTLRKFMEQEGFIEMETPVLQPIMGGAAARPFITKHNVLDRNFYLRVATELHLKRLIVGGFEKVFEIGRIFRNEGMDTTHNPEFTTMEAYWAYVTMYDWMELTEKLFKVIAQELKLTSIKYKDVEIDFSKSFKRINMVDFIKQETGVDFDKDIKTTEDAIKIAGEHHVKFEEHQRSRGHIINLFFEHFCEKKCSTPTFIYGHPVEISPLAKKNSKDPRYTERFELFICQKEYANSFSELNDPIDQFERFNSQMKEKSKGNIEANEMDIDFVEALEYGMPPCGGIGIGIDRLVMLFTNNESIRNVLLFPHMRDEK